MRQPYNLILTPSRQSSTDLGVQHSSSLQHVLSSLLQLGGYPKAQVFARGLADLLPTLVKQRVKACRIICKIPMTC